MSACIYVTIFLTLCLQTVMLGYYLGHLQKRDLLLESFWCKCVGHHMGRHCHGPWPGWTRYHCTRCDRWTVCHYESQFQTSVRGVDAVPESEDTP